MKRMNSRKLLNWAMNRNQRKSRISGWSPDVEANIYLHLNMETIIQPLLLKYCQCTTLDYPVIWKKYPETVILKLQIKILFICSISLHRINIYIVNWFGSKHDLAVNMIGGIDIINCRKTKFSFRNVKISVLWFVFQSTSTGPSTKIFKVRLTCYFPEKIC